MLSKLKKLDESLQALGLSKDEVLAYWLQEKGIALKHSNGVKEVKYAQWQDYPVIDWNFGEDDIRSRVDIGWYVFAGGHFSPNKNAYPNCQGVIGIINDDPTAEEGERIKIVLRHQKNLKWCEEYIYTKVTDEDNGRENTRRLLEYGKKKGLCFPAMEFARDYNFDGVKAGEAYVPAMHELKKLNKNYEVIHNALRQIGSSFCSSFGDWHWSSSEFFTDRALGVRPCGGGLTSFGKDASFAVTCLLDY